MFINFLIIGGTVLALGLIFYCINFTESGKESWKDELHGPINPHVVCGQCNTTGMCRVKLIDKKVGVSGGKATAAILTGGVSLLATGLARKEKVSQVTCGHCNSSWQF